MADNKFLTRLKGKQAPKSSVQIDEDKLSPVFGNMPVGSDGLENIIEQSHSSTVVAKGAQNWYLSGNSMVLSDSDQYTSEFKVNGQGLWINSSYTFTSASVVAPSAKWVLRFCGDNLLDATDHKITLSAIIKAGSTTLASKTFVLDEQANFFCKVLEFDLGDTYQSVHKFAVGSTLTVQLLCANDGASATIYNGKTTLTLLQRMVDADTVAFNGTPLIDVMTGHVAEDYFNRYQEQVVDGDKGMPVFSRAGTQMELAGWEEKTSVQVAEHNTSEEAHEDIRAEVATKQDQLTAGYNITIDENNVISATSEIGSRFADLLGSPYENENLAEALNAKADETDLQAHINDKTNPHEVTKAQIGLGNADNTADLDKPISTATQAALDLKADDSDLQAHISDTENPHSVTKAQVGLGNADNTSDADKPISTATQTALDAKQDTLVAGENIQIAADGKTISATDTTYTAGTNVDITDNVISATDTTYSAGNGLTLTGTTFSANVIDTTTSDSTINALSARVGKVLQEQINNLNTRGKYLSIWNCTTGLAMDTPPVDPYTYETGSFFIVGVVAGTGGTNYKPSGSTYSSSTPSTVVETEPVKPNDTYYYDGTTWRLLATQGGGTVAFSSILGSPYDNTNLSNALDAKQATLVSGTNIKTVNSTSLLGSGNIAVQPTLVSGTNIKTINSTSVLGTGNIAVQATITGGATTITSSNLTANRALVSNGSGKVAVSEVTSTELGYLDGVTSAIQTQLNNKSTVSVSATGTSTSEVQYITINGVEKKIAGGGSEEDNLSITKNDDDKIQTVGVIDQNDTTRAVKEWFGTRDEYDAITTKDDDTEYTITDDGDLSLPLLQTLYPVGSTYITFNETCPLANLFGTWQKVGAGRVLQGADSDHIAGSTIEAGLPNITGNLYHVLTDYGSAPATTGCFSSSTTGNYGSGDNNRKGYDTVSLDASNSNSIYGNSDTVQPAAICINIFKRTA